VAYPTSKFAFDRADRDGESATDPVEFMDDDTLEPIDDDTIDLIDDDTVDLIDDEETRT
jgi:hypothetical protein